MGRGERLAGWLADHARRVAVGGGAGAGRLRIADGYPDGGRDAAVPASSGCSPVSGSIACAAARSCWRWTSDAPLTLLIVPIAWAFDLLRIELLYAVAFFVGIQTLFYEVAWVSFLPSRRAA